MPACRAEGILASSPGVPGLKKALNRFGRNHAFTVYFAFIRRRAAAFRAHCIGPAEYRRNRSHGLRDGRLSARSTATLSRRELVDFSLGTFIDGASVMLMVDGPGGFAELSGKNVGVRGGTTTEEGLRTTLKKLSVDAKVVPVKTHDDGLSKLQKGELSAYFADRAILLFLAAGSGSPEKLNVGADYFSLEPYALALQRGDESFRLVVDRALSRLYRSGGITRIFRSSFGNAEPSDVLRSLYIINALPE